LSCIRKSPIQGGFLFLEKVMAYVDSQQHQGGT
jgi:hypothetical protein